MDVPNEYKKIINDQANRFSAKNLALIAVFVALMIVFTLFVSIPFVPVPLTFQTAICVLSGLILGKKKGAASMFIYFFMGFVCHIPIFSGFQGGFQMIFRVTFGYIIGFIPASFFAGFVKDLSPSPTLKNYIFGGITGFFVNYIIGIPYFLIIWKYHLNRTELLNAAVNYNLIYMPKDLLLCILAGFVAYKVNAILSKQKNN